MIEAYNILSCPETRAEHDKGVGIATGATSTVRVRRFRQRQSRRDRQVEAAQKTARRRAASLSLLAGVRGGRRVGRRAAKKKERLEKKIRSERGTRIQSKPCNNNNKLAPCGVCSVFRLRRAPGAPGKKKNRVPVVAEFVPFRRGQK